jgi:hypothetical protein
MTCMTNMSRALSWTDRLTLNSKLQKQSFWNAGKDDCLLCAAVGSILGQLGDVFPGSRTRLGGDEDWVAV